MSSIQLYNDLNKQFTKIHRISYLLNKRDLECVNALENWFVSTENILENNSRDYILIAQFRGQLMIELLRTDKKWSKRKRGFNAVSKIMLPLKEAIIDILEELSDKINESDVLINRMLSLKNFQLMEGQKNSNSILAIWRTLLNEQKTKSDAKMVSKLIGEEGALILIAQNIAANSNHKFNKLNLKHI